METTADYQLLKNSPTMYHAFPSQRLESTEGKRSLDQRRLRKKDFFKCCHRNLIIPSFLGTFPFNLTNMYLIRQVSMSFRDRAVACFVQVTRTYKKRKIAMLSFKEFLVWKRKRYFPGRVLVYKNV